MKLLRMEFFKCRRRKIALICLAFVAVQLAWMGRTLTQMEPGELAQGWMSLLYNLAVIDAVMLPSPSVPWPAGTVRWSTRGAPGSSGRP